MRKCLAIVAALLLIGVGTVSAQTIRVGLFGVAVTHTEVGEQQKAQGGGGGASLALRWRRFGLEAMGFRASLDPDSADLASFDLVQWDVRLSYWVASVVAVEIGGGRRVMDPEFSAQDVGAIRIGFLSEYPLARIASIRVRGAYLVDPKFNGGGEAGLAVEVGLAVAVGTSNGRFRVRAESAFQRIDRQVNGVDVPIQFSLGSLGIEFGF